MLDEHLQQYTQWSGSQDELVAAVIEFEQAHFGAAIKPPNKRTATFYRSKDIIEPAVGKKFEFRHLLQFLLARKLSREGWTIKQLSQTIAALNTAELCDYLDNTDALLSGKSTVNRPSPYTPDYSKTNNVKPAREQQLPLPELATRLLARGVIAQFNETSSEHHVVSGNQIPTDLKRAMSLLGQLCLREGSEDKFASVHDTLYLCRYPFNHTNWPLSTLKSDSFPFAMVNLIDIDHRCPTLDCMELAQHGNEANIREQFTFELLKQVCASFGGRRHEVYTLVREFVGRYPITSIQKIMSFTRDHSIGQVERFLTQECYRPIESSHLIEDQLYLCSTCGSPLSLVKDGTAQCTIRQCTRYHQHIELENGIFPDSDAMLLRSHLQAFWFGPAIDELIIYDLAVECGFDACLYPNSDMCDISIDGNDIGIDIKSYASPYLLAQALNNSIGGLHDYQRKVIGISDSCITNNNHYLEILKSHCTNNNSLEFKAVSDIVSWLKEAS